MKKTTKKLYLTNERLAAAINESQQKGEPTVEVCECFKLIATHLLGSPRYRGYSKQMHEDLVSAALIKCIKNIHNFKPEKGGSCFNYYTRCAEHAFWGVLAKHYRHLNTQRKIVMDYVDRLEEVDPKAAQYIRDRQLNVEHSKDKLNYKQEEDNYEQYD